MPDTFTTISHLINSPPGQLAAGGVLAGIVWKFFERVEALLTEQTKFEIAVWLAGRKPLGPKVEPWPQTFARVFDRVFGSRHLTWSCFLGSCLASLGAVVLICMSAYFFTGYIAASRSAGSGSFWGLTLLTVVIGNFFPDYCSLLKTRLVIAFMSRSNRMRYWVFLLVIDLIYSSGFAIVSLTFGSLTQWFVGAMRQGFFSSACLARMFLFYNLPWLVKHWIRPFPSYGFKGAALVWFYPAFFTSIWLWLYSGSGFILKAARRFDIGFDWFNRKFDIEKKRLQSIGLVAGALVALLYWTAVVIRHFV